MTIKDPASVRIAHMSATLRMCARMGRAPYLEEIQAWGDALATLALDVQTIEAGAELAARRANFDERVRAARLQ